MIVVTECGIGNPTVSFSKKINELTPPQILIKDFVILLSPIMKVSPQGGGFHFRSSLGSTPGSELHGVYCNRDILSTTESKQ